MKSAVDAAPIKDGWWCSTILKPCLPHQILAQVEEKKGAEYINKFVAHASRKASLLWERAQTCGGDPLDKFGATPAACQNVAPKARRASTRVSTMVYKDLTFDLPPLEDSYQNVEGQRLGLLKLAIHRVSHQRRAIFSLSKRTICEACPFPNVREEVTKRLQLLLKLDHVNILALHEACEDQKYLHLIYDWPEGGMLLRHFTQYAGDVTEAHLSLVFREVVAALEAAARFHLYHHDWSLMVLFLGYKDRFSPSKVFGIGLAGILVPLVSNRSVSRANKQFYVAPEILENPYHAMTHKKLHGCDIWSVGTLLYMMFSGRPPFSGKYSDVLAKIKKKHWSFGTEFDVLSREARNVVERMMDRNWVTRPSAQVLLNHPFLGQDISTRKDGVVGQDALTKLDHFARETHCKQTLARLLADIGLQDSAYSDLEDKFQGLDLDGNGVVDLTELEEVSKQFGELSSETIASIIAVCDRNGNGTIDISEFVAAVVLELESKGERLIIQAFDRMDMNRDAKITKGEIFRVLRQYSGTLETEDVSNFVSDVDKNNDKKIDYKEFKFLFPHVREKDEAIKARICGAMLQKDSQRKLWTQVLSAIQKFYKKVRGVAAKFAVENYRMSLQGGKPKCETIQEKTKYFEKVLYDWARKSDGKSTEATIRAEQKMLRKNSMPGLSMLNLSLNGDLRPVEGGSSKSPRGSGSPDGSPRHSGRATSPESPRHSGRATSPESPRHSGASPRATSTSPRSGSPSPRAGSGFNTELETSARGRPQKNLRQDTVADIYVSRLRIWPPNVDLRKEGKRIRKWLWFGTGEGLKHARAAVNGTPVTSLEDRSPRSGSDSPGLSNASSPRSVRAGSQSPRGQSSTTGPSKSPHESNASPGSKSPGSSPRPLTSGRFDASPRAGGSRFDTSPRTAGHSKVMGRQLQAAEQSDLVPWTDNPKKIKEIEMAMELAQGPMETKIGKIKSADKIRRLKQLGKDLCASCGFKYVINYNTDEHLCDLWKLLKQKCLRSWMPLIILIRQELERSMDEQKVHIIERHDVHTSALKLCAQMCEKIMFSLLEFILWQEDGLRASWTMEQTFPVPPMTERILPHRRGEIDDNAKTPRDEEDAERLAPDVLIDVHFAEKGSTTLDADGLPAAATQTADSGFTQSQNLHASQSLFSSSSRKLNRTNVRCRQALPKAKPEG